MNNKHSIGQGNIAHLMEGYASTGENYVFEQVNFESAYKGFLLAEWRLRHPHDPVPPARRAVFRVTLKNVFQERVIRFLARKPLETLYLYALNAFFEREIKHRGACLIHAHFGMMGYKALKVVRKTKLPLVVTFYGVDGSQAVKDPHWRPRLADMLTQASKVIVLCQEVADRLSTLGCDPRKIVVWDIGIPVHDYPYRVPRIKSVDKPTKFLTVARFVEKKGYPFLLQAFRNLVKSDGINATLTIAGNGPLKVVIEQLVREYELGDVVNVIDTTGMPDFFNLFKKLLNEHDIFVLPSVIAKNGDDEGGPPVVIANAQAVGLPVISTPIGGITRAITDGETGYLVEPGNIASLQKAMRDLAQFPGKLEAISRQARRHIEENFNVTTQLAKIAALYDDILGGAR